MNTALFVRLLGDIRDHLTLCDLGTEIASIQASTRYGDGESITVHLRRTDLPALAAGLLAWADTLTRVSVTLWRVPDGASVHLTVHGLLANELPVAVYGGVRFDPDTFGTDLEPGGQHRVALGVLRGWTTPEVAA